ncbi:MAG: protease inhibitor I42 family protein [Weeksellaceae bacterium]|nr:protease inhibitor I42 family protein [Weeksellaceae bacterium]
MKKYFILSIAVLGLTGCKNTLQENWNYFPDTVELSSYNHLQFVKVKKGNTVQVNMEENPSTGYFWSVASENDCSVTVDGEKFTQNQSAEGMVGVPGVRTFDLTGVESGSCLVEFKQEKAGEEPLVKKGIYFIVE